MKLKVCGMKEKSNIADLIKVIPDYIGFIFYPKSQRYVGESWDPEIAKSVPSYISKVGVFVNKSLQDILVKVKIYNLNFVQLHGKETPDDCKYLFYNKIPIIKAFSVDEDFDFDILKDYEEYCEYFLFDTKGKSYGGNGIKFDWNILKKYTLSKPIFLSGGIDLEDAEEINKLEGINIQAIDINSKFEIYPGKKDITKIQKFKDSINK